MHLSGFSLGLPFWSWRWSRYVAPKCQASSKLQIITMQMELLFVFSPTLKTGPVEFNARWEYNSLPNSYRRVGTFSGTIPTVRTLQRWNWDLGLSPFTLIFPACWPPRGRGWGGPRVPLWVCRPSRCRQAKTHPCHINSQLSWQDVLAHSGKSFVMASCTYTQTWPDHFHKPLGSDSYLDSTGFKPMEALLHYWAQSVVGTAIN
jgi:hypothetical protein